MAEVKISASIDGGKESIDTIGGLIAKVNELADAQREKGKSSEEAADLAKKQADAERELGKAMSVVLTDMRGSRAQVNAVLAQERQMQTDVNDAIRQNVKEYKSGSISTEEFRSRGAQLIGMQQSLSASTKELSSDLNAETRQINAASGSMDEMNQTLGRLRNSYRAMSAEEREGAIGKQTQFAIQGLDTQLKALDANIGNHQRNVGNYVAGFSPLGFQVQQLTRELPSLTISAQQFFLAISNNLPMLADEIKRVNVANKELIAQGQKAPSVFGQVVKSLLSWQTGLVVGITLLTKFGPAIGEWIAGMFRGKEAADDMAASVEKVNSAIDYKGLGSSIANLLHLSNAYKEVGDSAAEKQRFLKDYAGAIEQAGLNVKTLSEAERVFVNNTGDVVKAMTDRAFNQAVLDKAGEQFAKAIERQIENADELKLAQFDLNRIMREGDDYVKKIEVGTTALDRFMGSAGKTFTITREQAISEAEQAIAYLSGAEFTDQGKKIISLMRDVSDKALEELGGSVKKGREKVEKEIGQFTPKMLEIKPTTEKPNFDWWFDALEDTFADDASSTEGMIHKSVGQITEALEDVDLENTAVFGAFDDDDFQRSMGQLSIYAEMIQSVRDRITVMTEELPDLPIDKQAEQVDQIEALTKKVDKAEENLAKERDRREKEEEERLEKERRARERALKYTADALNAGADLLGENTVESKILATAAATINTYLAASQVFADPSNPTLFGKIAGMTAAIVAGLATVKAIWDTDVPGKSSSGGSSSYTPAMPAMPTEYTTETYRSQDGTETDVFNNPLSAAGASSGSDGGSARVMVVESGDIASVLGRVDVSERESTF